MIGWRETLAISPLNRIHFLILHAKEIAKRGSKYVIDHIASQLSHVQISYLQQQQHACCEDVAILRNVFLLFLL
jgi:hypothetical protein